MNGLKISKRVVSVFLAFTVLLSMFAAMPGFAAEDMSEDELKALMETFQRYENTFTGNGASDSRHYITNGELYTWGENDGWTLGYNQYTDINGNLVKLSRGDSWEKVPLPVLVNKSNFGDEKLTRVFDGGRSVVAITESGKLYGWGSMMSSITGKSGTAVGIPTRLDVPTNGAKIVDAICAGNNAVAAKDENGVWYMAGVNRNGTILNGEADEETYDFFAIPQPILDSLGEDAAGNPRKIKSIMPSAYLVGTRTLVVTEDGYLFGFGKSTTIDGVGSESYVTTPYNMTENIPSLSGVRIKQFEPTCEGTYYFMDENGDIFYSDVNAEKYGVFIQHLPKKVFDASDMGETPLFLQSDYIGYSVICKGNKVYAGGWNHLGMLDPDNGVNTYLTSPVQIAKNLTSQNKTIVRVIYSAEYINIMTSDGTIYFDGSNEHGGAGSGSMGSDSNHVIGSGVVETETIVPPMETLSANQLVLELEMSNGVLYQPTTDGGDMAVNQIMPDGQKYYLADGAEIPAGEVFKLNVYFNDFASIHGFVLPIRFDATYLQVVNGQGEPYSDKALVTPGAIGEAVGIESYITDEVWKGGRLAVGYAESTYPKIDNQYGYVSVVGLTENQDASISGKQKMFSISFISRGTNTVGTGFSFATASNVPDDAPQGKGYDTTGSTKYDKGAEYTITTAVGDAAIGQFEFNPDEKIPVDWPKFKTKLEEMTEIGVKLYRTGTTDVEVTDKYDPDGTTGTEDDGYAINCDNSTTVYKVMSIPNPSTTGTASFPQVSWTVSVDQPESGVEVSDLITITEQTNRYIKFRVVEGYSIEELLSCLKFTATSVFDGGKRTGSSLVYIKSFEAPTYVRIEDKMYDDDGIAAIEEFIYHYDDNHAKSENEDKHFNAVFPEDTLNTTVLWRLFDSNGVEVDPTDASAKVLIDMVTDDTKEAKIAPKHSTGDDYVTLRVESVYDPEVYDEVKIKVQLYITALEFSPALVRMPTDTTKDLKSHLKIVPADYYASDLVWTHETDYGKISFNTTSLITALSTASDAGAYEKIKVYDNLSTESAEVEIEVLSLNSPLMPQNFKAYNLLGDENDYLHVLSGLKAGDQLAFYDTMESETPWYTTPELGDGEHPEATFEMDGHFDGKGGTMGVQLIRDPGTGKKEFYSIVPVDYAQEPSEVYGYVRLAQKNKYSVRNVGILVELSGTGSTQSTYTTEGGYFVFDEYIPGGTYKITFTRDRYLKRTISVTIPTTDKFAISTDTKPVPLYPGDYDHNNKINKTDVDYYVGYWVGQTDTSLTDFNSFDWYDVEDSTERGITLEDLGMATVHSGWVKDSYPAWTTPKQ